MEQVNAFIIQNMADLRATWHGVNSLVDCIGNKEKTTWDLWGNNQ